MVFVCVGRLWQQARDQGGGGFAGRVVVDQETLIADKEGVEIVHDQVVGELGRELIGFGLLLDGLDWYPA
jgi:hypothetical protein